MQKRTGGGPDTKEGISKEWNKKQKLKKDAKAKENDKLTRTEKRAKERADRDAARGSNEGGGD